MKKMIKGIVTGFKNFNGKVQEAQEAENRRLNYMLFEQTDLKKNN